MHYANYPIPDAVRPRIIDLNLSAAAEDNDARILRVADVMPDSQVLIHDADERSTAEFRPVFSAT